LTITLYAFFSPISSPDHSDSILEKLRSTGVTVIVNDASLVDLGPGLEQVHVFIGTGGTEKQVIESLKKHGNPKRVVLLSHDKSNSLPAAMEIRSYLEQQGTAAHIVHGPLPELLERISRWLEASQILQKIWGRRIGVIGQPSSWLVGSSVDTSLAAKVWGLSVVPISFETLIHNLPPPSPHELGSEELCKNASNTLISIDDRADAVRVKNAMKQIMVDYHLSAITVECFKLLESNRISGCLALSEINNMEEYVAGCEGDFPSVFTMLLVKSISGSPSFMANVTDVNEEENTAVFAHCTVPTKIVEDYDIVTHFETGLSAAVRGRFAEQEVTILKVHGSDLTSYWASSGTIVENLSDELACRTQVRVRLEKPVAYFLEHSLANHHILVPGNYVEAIDSLFSYLRTGS
jgi:L-fucose isomerase-like protein